MIVLTFNTRKKHYRLFVPAKISYFRNRITVILFKNKGSNGRFIASYDKYRGHELEAGRMGYVQYGKLTITFDEKDGPIKMEASPPELFSLSHYYGYTYYVELNDEKEHIQFMK